MSEYVKLEYAGWVHCPMNGEKQVTGKLKNADDSLFTVNLQGIKEQKSKLESVDTPTNTPTNTPTDIISRQATIEAIEERFFAGTVADINPSWRLLHEIIESLPSVGSTPVCEDAISKHDLWRIIEDNAYWVTYNETSKEKGMTLTGINQALNECPPVEPERPKGEWIEDNLGTVICSECKRPRRDNRVNHTKFCNSCGADMRGKENE